MSSAQLPGTVIIAAHNEEAVIGRGLTSLARALADGVRVVVVCNGCSDGTAGVARGHPGVTVIELDTASKAAALRAGDRVAAPGPRVYLDADVVMTSRAVVDVLHALADGPALAGRPPSLFDYADADGLVRRWYSIRERLPSIQGTLWGAGAYALAPAGRARFEEFPDILSDDLFIDSLFAEHETAIIDTDPVIVRTPRRTADLVRVLKRSYRTQHEVPSGDALVSDGQRGQLGDLVRLLRARPSELPNAVVYATTIVFARIAARVSQGARWERDTSSRESPTGH